MGGKLRLAAFLFMGHEIMGRGHHGGEGGGGRAEAHSRSSSIDSSNSNYPINFLSSSVAAASSSSPATRDLSTDLKLGLSISPISNNNVDVSSSTSSQREQRFDWPPIKPHLRSTLAELKAADHRHVRHGSLFVKVYMEGIPIGRKLDLFTQDGYKTLMTTLRHMFRTTILCPGDCVHHHSERDYYVLTYEDKEGDWMMVGDVPWEMFLTTVKRLKITRSDRC